MKNILKIFFTISLLINGLIAFCQPPPAWQLQNVIDVWEGRVMPSAENLDSTWHYFDRRGNGSYISGTPTHYSIFTDTASLGDGYLTQLGNYVRIPDGKDFSGTDTLRSTISISKEHIWLLSNSTINLDDGYTGITLDSLHVGMFYQDTVSANFCQLVLSAGYTAIVNNTTINLYAPLVTVGTPELIPTAALSVNTTTQGFLPPRLTTTQRDAIVSPEEGLMIYDITTHKVAYYNGTIWVEP